MRKTKTSSAVKNRYNAKTYDRITIVIPKGDKERIREFAKNVAGSANEFILDAVYTRMGEENPFKKKKEESADE